jgi:Flp pilus assembly secretin CpaC
MTDVCARVQARLRLIYWQLMGWLLAALLILAVSATAHAAETIVVQLDRTTLIKLPPQTATVVIGDPLIADLSIQPGGLAMITGKGYGETNVIALDRDGAVLSEETIEVNGPGDPIVVVDRGDARS